MEGPIVSPVAHVREVLTTACRKSGLDPTNAAFLGYSMNAAFLLESVPVVVRLRMGSRTVATRAVATARWLSARQAPAIRLYERVDQPLEVEGYAATFWVAARPDAERFQASDLALPLLDLHGLEPPPWLPRWDPFAYIRTGVNSAGWLDSANRAWLRGECARVEHEYDKRRPALQHGTIHANAKIGNILRDHSGQIVLCDLDSMAVGPLAYDLAPTAVSAARFGRVVDHTTLADTYGFDVMRDPAWPLLRRIRELELVTFWLARPLSESGAAEVRYRLKCMREGDSSARWRRYRRTDSVTDGQMPVGPKS